jgi:hypothetical protein
VSRILPAADVEADVAPDARAVDRSARGDVRVVRGEVDRLVGILRRLVRLVADAQLRVLPAGVVAPPGDVEDEDAGAGVIALEDARRSRADHAIPVNQGVLLIAQPGQLDTRGGIQAGEEVGVQPDPVAREGEVLVDVRPAAQVDADASRHVAVADLDVEPGDVRHVDAGEVGHVAVVARGVHHGQRPGAVRAGVPTRVRAVHPRCIVACGKACHRERLRHALVHARVGVVHLAVDDDVRGADVDARAGAVQVPGERKARGDRLAAVEDVVHGECVRGARRRGDVAGVAEHTELVGTRCLPRHLELVASTRLAGQVAEGVVRRVDVNRSAGVQGAVPPAARAVVLDADIDRAARPVRARAVPRERRGGEAARGGERCDGRRLCHHECDEAAQVRRDVILRRTYG